MAFQVEPDETSSHLQLILYWRDRLLMHWVPQPASGNSVIQSSVASTHPRDDVDGDQDLSDRIFYSDCNDSLPGPEGRVVEITRANSSGQPTSLRVVLGETDRLRKPKELLEASCTPGMYWRAGVAADGTGALHVDIYGAHCDEAIGVMLLKLPAALLLYLLPVKPKRSVKASSAKKPKKDLG
jgi:hypothetical protein